MLEGIQMQRNSIFIALIFSFLFTGCAGYSPQMRAANDSYFFSQCEKNDPNGNHQDHRLCANYVHDQTASQVTSQKNTQVWSKVFDTVLGAGLIATQVITKTSINNPFNNSQNQYMPVGYQQNYNPCNQFTPDNSFQLQDQNQYTPIATEIVRF